MARSNMETLGNTFKSIRSTCKCYLGATDRQVPPLFGVLRRWRFFFFSVEGIARHPFVSECVEKSLGECIMYMMMRVTRYSIIHLFSTEISANERSVRKIEIGIYIYIYIFLNIAGALIVIQYLVICWQIEPNSLERPDISQANQMLDIFIMAW